MQVWGLKETTIWNSFRIDLKNATSRESFKKLMAKERKNIEKVKFERETAINSNIDIETYMYFLRLKNTRCTLEIRCNGLVIG